MRSFVLLFSKRRFLINPAYHNCCMKFVLCHVDFSLRCSLDYICLIWLRVAFVIRFSGAIELSILAEYYGREIAAYDIQTTRCDLYGQVSISYELFKNLNLVGNYHQWSVSNPCILDNNWQKMMYSERIMLIYDGLHYDALAVSFPILNICKCSYEFRWLG